MKSRQLLSLLALPLFAACASHQAKPVEPSPAPLSFFTEGSDHCDYVPGFREEQKARDKQMVGSKYALLTRGRAKAYAHELDDEVCKLTLLKRELQEGRAQALCQELGTSRLSPCLTAALGKIHERHPISGLTVPLYLAMQVQFVMEERRDGQKQKVETKEQISDRALLSFVEALDSAAGLLRTRAKPPADDEELIQLEAEETTRLCRQLKKLGLRNVEHLLGRGKKGAEGARLREAKKNFEALGDCGI